MKVYILTKGPFPNGMAATNRIKCYARAIKDGGIECEVIVCGCTEFDRKRILNKEARGFYEDVPFQYIGGRTTDTRPRILRSFFQFIRLKKTEWFLNKQLCSGDILFLYIGKDLNQTLRFIKIAKRKKAKCVRDLCELPYVTGTETERTIRLRAEICKKQFPLFDGIISISDNLMNVARTYSSQTCKHLKVPIMVEYEHYYIIKTPSNNENPYLFHAGTLYQQKDGILGMIEAFGIAKKRLNTSLKYILTGEMKASSHPIELQHLMDQYELEDSIEFVGYLNREQIKEYLTHASLVISNRPKSQQDYYGFSTKVGEYLASGTPLVMTNWGESVNWLENGKTAIITEPEDTESLANAIVTVISHPEESRIIGLAGQEVCRNCFDYRNWSKPIVEFFYQLGM